MEDVVSQTDEGKWGQESEFPQDNQGLTCEKTPQQSPGGTQSPAYIQQEEENRSSPKEKATEFLSPVLDTRVLGIHHGH